MSFADQLNWIYLETLTRHYYIYMKQAIISKSVRNSSVCPLGGDSIVFEHRNTKGITDPAVH
jgi:hypothetical protein